MKNGTVETLTGTATLLKGRIPVLQSGTSQIYVALPGKWIVNSQEVLIEGLFDGDSFSFGAQLSIKTLKLEYKAKTHRS